MKKNVFRKSLVIGIIILFVGASNILVGGTENINILSKKQSNFIPPFEVWVNNDYNNKTPGWNVTHFDNIQAGVNAVGGIVYVCNGTYYENVNITKSLDLIGIDEDYLWGNDKNGSIIDGRGIGNVIGISASSVTVTGFIIRNSGRLNGAGIYVRYNNYIQIKNNIIEDCYYGIDFYWTKGYLDEPTLEKNTIWNNKHSINLLHTEYIEIKDNYIVNNMDGVALLMARFSRIHSNEISNNSRYGIFLELSWENEINHNNFRKNKYHVSSINCRNSWDFNHWNPNPYKILGIYIIWGLKCFYKSGIYLPTMIQIDWHALPSPYDIDP